MEPFFPSVPREKPLLSLATFFREERALGWYPLGVESRKGLAAWQASEWGRGERKSRFPERRV